MRYNQNNMSHRKHRSGPFGTKPKKHRDEVGRLLANENKRKRQRFYDNVADLMRRERKGK